MPILKWTSLHEHCGITEESFDLFIEQLESERNIHMEYKKQLPAGYAPRTGYWIVGSFQNGNFSVASQPVQHATETNARVEAERLANLDPKKKFIVLEVKGTVTIAQHVWE